MRALGLRWCHMWFCDVHKTPVITAATDRHTLVCNIPARSCQHPLPAFPDQVFKFECV